MKSVESNEKNGFKSILLNIIIWLAIIIQQNVIYRIVYLNSYCDIPLSEEISFMLSDNTNQYPHWWTLESEESVDAFCETYNISLTPIDFSKNMYIVSCNAELVSMDYSKMESTYKTRKHYIGFPKYGKEYPDRIYVYKATYVPIFSSEVGCRSSDYRGEYR